jgi:hypothetical protein
MPPDETATVPGRARVTPEPRTRRLTIVAQDPSVRRAGKILRAYVDVPAERLGAGPWGHRVQIIDYDTTTDRLFKPLGARRHALVRGAYVDPYEDATDAVLLDDPNFHAQNVYAITMRTLARFEFALGRRVSWGFAGHQLKVAPHAFADANAFYSPPDEALLFGYFPSFDRRRTVFTCLSHDVVAHETTHALVDGVRRRFNDPASPDQAAFHEGFADVVALLSVFSLPRIVEIIVDLSVTRRRGKTSGKLIARAAVTPNALRDSLAFGLAEEMGQELAGVRGRPLRQSAKLPPKPDYYLSDPDFVEPHRRGELLVAAMLDTFLRVWVERLIALGEIRPGYLDRQRVVEEGVVAADYLLTMAIRALDYTPPVSLEFGDFLSALVTADAEIRPDDSRYRFRAHLLQGFAAFGIRPASAGTPAEPGLWRGAPEDLKYQRTHFEPMQRDPDEVFWFIWENLRDLGVFEGAYGHVLSVRPCLRVAPDGFPLRETVAEFYQVLQLTADELPRVGLTIPDGMPRATRVSLYGGNALIFDEYGKLKFNIYNPIKDVEQQQRRLNYLWQYGYFGAEGKALRRFDTMHVRRALDATANRVTGEEW